MSQLINKTSLIPQVLFFGLFITSSGCSYSRAEVVVQVIDADSRHPIIDGVVSAVYGPRGYLSRSEPTTHSPLDKLGVSRQAIKLEGTCNLVIAANGYRNQVIGVWSELPTPRQSPSIPGLMVHYVVELARREN